MINRLTNLAFAARLNRLRKNADLTTLELSKKVGISDATISRYETGKREPSLINAAKLANFFNVSLDWISGQDTDTREEYLLNLYRKFDNSQKTMLVNYAEFLLSGSGNGAKNE